MPVAAPDRTSCIATSEPWELPPRARGRLVRRQVEERQVGATPASAGTTWSGTACTALAGSYPRERGDDVSAQRTVTYIKELPPRARERRFCSRVMPSSLGATPASAGTTTLAASWSRTGRSYPRERGDDCKVIAVLSPPRELPPRARGRPGCGDHDVRLRGATPASAGTTCPRAGRSG